MSSLVAGTLVGWLTLCRRFGTSDVGTLVRHSDVGGVALVEWCLVLVLLLFLPLLLCFLVELTLIDRELVVGLGNLFAVLSGLQLLFLFASGALLLLLPLEVLVSVLLPVVGVLFLTRSVLVFDGWFSLENSLLTFLD